MDDMGFTPEQRCSNPRCESWGCAKHDAEEGSEMSKIAKYRTPGLPGQWYVTDFTMDQIEEHIRNLEAMAKKITHCPDCGSTWYDDGFTAACPQCRVRRLQKHKRDIYEYERTIKRYEERTHRLEARLVLVQQARAELVRGVEEVVEDMHFVSRWAIKEKLHAIAREGKG